MTVSHRVAGWLVALAVGASVLGASAPAAAQQAVRLSRTEPRVLSDITDTVKDDDGTRVTLRTVLAYDPVEGTYVQTVTEADGRVRSRTVRDAVMLGPTADEDEAARALIATDPSVGPLVARALHPVEITGGFPLVREAGHACGPGARCLQYEVVEVVPGQAFGRRLRYVVVDLRTVRMVSADLDPALEGNLANPAIRAQSRSRE